MRTTVTLAPDVAAEVERRRREGVGVSEAINELARAGMARRAQRRPHRTRTYPMGLRIDVSNIGEALEQLDGPARR